MAHPIISLAFIDFSQKRRDKPIHPAIESSSPSRPGLVARVQPASGSEGAATDVDRRNREGDTSA
jgi:hypothetical protein